ncbi:hypothetical protein [Mycolicibacterium komossense]|uniref:Uncharacterized protein n=1 Tax=Mycolicibacterium komossense TaxID=1779 RepID=A0ABT3C9B3_9MYCO|nr:hypothetical protein [Mycolicibacterium komossense]MCV7226050.1 hypothetical protein [Mycolicibacterium komossense]
MDDQNLAPATVFDETGHVELTDYDVMFAVFRELYEGQLGKWRGNIMAHRTTADGGPGYILELNPEPSRLDRPGFTVYLHDHLQKMPFGVIMAITPADFAEYQASLL